MESKTLQKAYKNYIGPSTKRRKENGMLFAISPILHVTIKALDTNGN